MFLKPPISFDEQVERLKSHNMIVNDSVHAREFLAKVNYYRFSGYALHLRSKENNNDYVDGTSFDDIERLYLFDESLRNVLRPYIEKVEIFMRSQISYNFAMNNCALFPHDQHYDYKNYYRPEKAEGLFSKFKNLADEYYGDQLIVQHHRQKYESKYPLWVIVEMLNLSDLSKLYSCMYYQDRTSVSNILQMNCNVLSNNLHCISVLRNKCAHAIRLYNTTYYPSASLPRRLLSKYPSILCDSLFAYIFVLIRCLPTKHDKQQLCSSLFDLISSNLRDDELTLIGFPSDYISFLSDTVGLKQNKK